MEGSKCLLCPYFHTVCVKLKGTPFHKEIKVSKTTLQRLPQCFQKTVLGEPKGALKQFRGPHGIHILEYEKEWVLHRDRVDPRVNPVGHLIKDAPQILVIGGLAAFVGVALIIKVGKKSN